MPLDRVQSDILRLLASHRDPESDVAGSTPLHVTTPRFSGDIDIFHDREERVAQAALSDAAVLQANGYTVEWLRREPALYTAAVSRADGTTRLDWAADSDFRFSPAVPDPLFGYMLHPVDLAANKAMAAAGRREPRDVIDLLTIHQRILPLGAVIWCATGKSLGFTPEGLIDEIRRLARYTAADFARVASDPPADPAATMAQLRQALADAEAFITRMPSSLAGLVFLDGATPVQPDPDRLDAYSTHAGQRRGHWPANPTISAAMIDRYTGRAG